MSNIKTMSNTKKIRVAVLYGGRSGEHEVSLVSAMNVIQHLDRSRFDVVPIGIDKQGGWFLGDDILKKTELSAPAMLRLQREEERQLFAPTMIGKTAREFKSQCSSSVVSKTNPLTVSIHKNNRQNEYNQNDHNNHRQHENNDHNDHNDHRQNESNGQNENNNQIDFLANRLFDVVFPVIHGPLCEDGTVQGLLELAEVPYVGCSVLASAIGMDKDISKRLAKNAGILVPPYLAIKRAHWEKNPAHVCAAIEKKLRYPLFVKPSNTGSSVGISKVKKSEELVKAVNMAFKYDTKVVVEQGIDAIEIEVAVLESLEYGGDPIVSVPGEIRPTAKHEFYSYASKYLDENGAELLIPAPISEALQDKVREVAKDIFLALDCEGMARIDLFIERGSHHVYFNEINSIPGFTKISMYPKLMCASGITYPELLTHLVSLATDRHARKKELSREYIAE
jgi:D-alanine-D-alanine ligase